MLSVEPVRAARGRAASSYDLLECDRATELPCRRTLSDPRPARGFEISVVGVAGPLTEGVVLVLELSDDEREGASELLRLGSIDDGGSRSEVEPSEYEYR